MKILLTGGVTGGHFYPLIAVAEAINKLSLEKHLLKPELYFMGPDPYDKDLLFQNDIKFIKSTSGKLRRYFSLLNLLDIFKIAYGAVLAFFSVYKIFPDVIFSKGGSGRDRKSVV